MKRTSMQNRPVKQPPNDELIQLRQENELLRRMITGDNELALNNIETLKRQRDAAYKENALLKSELFTVVPDEFATPNTTSETRVGIALFIERSDGKIIVQNVAAAYPETPEAIEAQITPQIIAMLNHMPLDVDIWGNPETCGLSKIEFLELCYRLSRASDVETEAEYKRKKSEAINGFFLRMVKQSDHPNDKSQRQTYYDRLAKQIKGTLENMDNRLMMMKVQHEQMTDFRRILSNPSDR